MESHGMYTMGDVARMSVKAEDVLYRLFGVNAELLIDHAWGWEPVTIDDIKSYRPESSSLSSGQVLQEPYDFEKARLVAKEMADLLTLDLVAKRLVTDQRSLSHKRTKNTTHMTLTRGGHGENKLKKNSVCAYETRDKVLHFWRSWVLSE